MCDKWRIRNLKFKKLNFRLHQFSGILQRRLDYLISQTICENRLKMIKYWMPYQQNILHYFAFINLRNISRGRNLWNSNNSLVSNTNFVDEMKALIQKIIFSLENGACLTDQVKWELLKHEIRKFAISFSRKIAQNSRKLSLSHPGDNTCNS